MDVLLERHWMCISDYRRGFGFGYWIHWPFIYRQLGTTSNYNDLSNLNTLQITTAPLRVFPAWVVLEQRLLAMKILQLRALKSLLSGEYHENKLLSTVNWTISPTFLSLPCGIRLNCQPSTYRVPSWWPFHFSLLVFSSQTDIQLTTELSHSATSYFKSFHSAELHSAKSS
jgi:hypothetical protein